MKNKKTIKKIIFAILIVALSVVFLAFQKEKTQRQKNNYINPKIYYPSDSAEIKTKIELNLQKDNFNFPQKIPYLIKGQIGMTKEDAQKIASNLGFDKNPIEFEDVLEGKILIWNGENYDLTINLKSSKIRYYFNSNPIEKIERAQNKQLKNEDFVSIAKNFLKEKIGIPEDKIYFTNITFLKPEKDNELFIETNQENSKVFQVNFSQKINNIVVLNIAPTQFLYYVQILKDGEILNSEINLIDKIEKNNSTFIKIKNYEEVLSTIQQSKLISLDGGNINIPDIPTDYIKSSTIEKIELAYLLDNPKNNTLPPVFILSGKAETKDGREIKAIFYLDAVSNNQN